MSEKALKIGMKRKVKSKGEQERYSHLNAEFQRIARRVKKAFLSDQCKEIEENNRMGSTTEIGIKRRLHTQKFTIIIHLIFQLVKTSV